MEARFVEKIDMNGENGCWIWTGCKNADGYGQFHVDGKMCRAHRIAYELWVGQIPVGLVVRHKCNTPACVNPEHLETGTTQDNVDDRQRAGRQAKGETNGNAKLTEAQVLEIRSRVGQTQRELAKEFGVNYRLICDILHGKCWNHI